MIQKLALLLCLSLVLSTVDSIDTWHIACVYLLVAAWGWLQYQEGYAEATELGQAVWQSAKTALDEARKLNDEYEQHMNRKDTQ